jgi:hypothetical protein
MRLRAGEVGGGIGQRAVEVEQDSAHGQRPCGRAHEEGTWARDRLTRTGPSLRDGRPVAMV